MMINHLKPINHCLCIANSYITIPLICSRVKSAFASKVQPLLSEMIDFSLAHSTASSYQLPLVCSLTVFVVCSVKHHITEQFARSFQQKIYVTHTEISPFPYACDTTLVPSITCNIGERN